RARDPQCTPCPQHTQICDRAESQDASFRTVWIVFWETRRQPAVYRSNIGGRCKHSEKLKGRVDSGATFAASACKGFITIMSASGRTADWTAMASDRRCAAQASTKATFASLLNVLGTRSTSQSMVVQPKTKSSSGNVGVAWT
ncbi:hypothetical protein QE361_003634, partial [Sphingomonas sp. SORGH_AS802]